MENIKQKRIITRVGDIFCIELKKQKVFFQFIAVDCSELNSATIRVFQKKYSQDYVFDADEVVKAYVCTVGDIWEVSDEGFSGTPAKNKTLTVASKKWVVGA